jgi:ribonuclease D
MKTALEEAARLPLAEEDFRRMCDAPPVTAEPEASNWWRVAAGQEINAQQAAVLYELCQYRDNRARAADLPPFKVLSNQMLVSIAQNFPKNSAELVKVTGLNGRQYERHAEGLLEAVKRGLDSPPLRRTQQPRPDDHYLNRLDYIKNWRKNTGQSWGVDSDVILPRDIMEAIALNPPRTPADLDVLMATIPWRREQFGPEILRLFRY